MHAHRVGAAELGVEEGAVLDVAERAVRLLEEGAEGGGGEGRGEHCGLQQLLPHTLLLQSKGRLPAQQFVVLHPPTTHSTCVERALVMYPSHAHYSFGSHKASPPFFGQLAQQMAVVLVTFERFDCPISICN